LLSTPPLSDSTFTVRMLLTMEHHGDLAYKLYIYIYILLVYIEVI
jgi:hypothetical protein